MIWLLCAAFVVCVNADGPVIVCEDCEYSVGGIGYLPGPDCRQFYQCRKKSGGWIEEVLMCCPDGTSWNQDIKVCDWGHCDVGFENCTYDPYEEEPCNLWADDTSQAWYYINPVWQRMMCPAGTVFKQEFCGCVHGYGYMCYSDPLLHFPFAYHFNDIQCPKAAGMGHGNAVIDTHDGYMKLDGDGDYMTFAYLNNYFERNAPDHFTISLWIKQTAEGFNGGIFQGLFSNGNCHEEQTIWLWLGNEIAGGGIMTTQDTADFDFSNSSRFYGPPNVWCNIAIRFSKPDMKVSYFLNGHEVDMKTVKGDIKGTMSDSSVGLATIDCVPYFFDGCIDDLMVFDRYVSNWEMFDCVYGLGRTLGHSEKMYECPDHQPMRTNGD